MAKRPIEERFWPKVDRSSGAQSCWLWTAGRDLHGYGDFHRGETRPKQKTRAHIVSWEIANGRRVPDGLCVLHRCDNPPCVNPAHLFVGTKKDNTQDMVAKGRCAFRKKMKLTDHAVMEMRALRARGMKLMELAARFDVHQSYVERLVSGRRRPLTE